MAIVAFDALKFIDQLEKAGYSEHQAKETAKAYQYAHESLELVTKQDVDAHETRLEYKIELVRKEIETLKAETKQDLRELELKIILKLSAVMFSGLTISVSVMLWFMYRWHI